jgi:hypothetical protein
MGREILLTLLVLLFGGLAMQPFMLLPGRDIADLTTRTAEHRAWLQLWVPVLPMLFVCAGLCGWALREPDPVRARFDHGMLIGASLPFALLALRAALRAGWALVREPLECPVCTVGMLRPRIVVDPYLARALDEAQLRAAIEHERAHARHRDPLRIWLAQLVTDLQWPWPWAHRRFEVWLELVEHARDDEARGRGVPGTDLAEAVLATARRARLARHPMRAAWRPGGEAALLGDARSLELRVRRLLAPVPADHAAHAARADPSRSAQAALALVAVSLGLALVLGALFGNDLLHPFFHWTWSV